LQDGSWEEVYGLRSKDKLKVFVDFFCLIDKTIANGFERGHPRLEEMAVLEHNPKAVFHASFDEATCFSFLTLTE